jgi:hypothetical protein
VWEEATSGLSPRVCSDVKVPGNITKPARRILVVGIRGMVFVL